MTGSSAVGFREQNHRERAASKLMRAYHTARSDGLREALWLGVVAALEFFVSVLVLLPPRQTVARDAVRRRAASARTTRRASTNGRTNCCLEREF